MPEFARARRPRLTLFRFFPFFHPGPQAGSLGGIRIEGKPDQIDATMAGDEENGRGKHVGWTKAVQLKLPIGDVAQWTSLKMFRAAHLKSCSELFEGFAVQTCRPRDLLLSLPRRGHRRPDLQGASKCRRRQLSRGPHWWLRLLAEAASLDKEKIQSEAPRASAKLMGITGRPGGWSN